MWKSHSRRLVFHLAGTCKLQLNVLGYIQTAVDVVYETRVYVEVSW